jgi:hypothetical protein
MITGQLSTQIKNPEAGYPSAYDLQIEQASRDERVARMAAHFMEIDFEVNQTEVLAVAAEHGIFPDDVTERACLVHIVRKMDEAVYG